eukprot:3487963-Pyramimonas_sp.AAC.1
MSTDIASVDRRMFASWTADTFRRDNCTINSSSVPAAHSATHAVARVSRGIVNWGKFDPRIAH